MKDENIKEILEYLKALANGKWIMLDLSNEEYKILYDYITNLQQKYECAIFIGKELNKDNERLKEELEITQQKWDKDKQWVECRTKEWLDYKTRNEKAIEFMKENCDIITLNNGWIIRSELTTTGLGKLFKILNGGDE